MIHVHGCHTAANGHSVWLSPYSFEDTLVRLHRAIEGADMMVIHEIDTQAILREADIEVGGIRQLFYFRPSYMKAVNEIHPEAMLEAPLKFVVREDDSGETLVNYWQPSTLFERHESLKALGHELDGIVAQILVAAQAPD